MSQPLSLEYIRANDEGICVIMLLLAEFSKNTRSLISECVHLDVHVLLFFKQL